ncbi:filamentous hemagglutinin family protein, partial [Methylohalomonas lacus]
MLTAQSRLAQRLQARFCAVLLTLQFLAPTGVVWANPSGEQVAAGDVQFERSGNDLIITQGSNRAVINWQDFSIGADELTQFLQPDSSSSTLNRVISNNPSEILGTLAANGNIFLINQNGILVGADAVIDTHSFLASTLDVSNEAFMEGGDLTFLGESQAAIQNLGTITANGGDVYLIARKIDNSGSISAAGEAGLLAGTEVLLRAEGDNRGAVLVGTSNDSIEDGAAIKNSGDVEAARATLDATGSMYSVAINNEGTVRATGADTSNGRVRLTAGGGNIENSGTIAAQNADGSGGEIEIAAGSNDDNTATVMNSGTVDASGYADGATGGSVEITGDRVALIGDALVDASGDTGGGQVNIGGGFQGNDADIQNAERTHVGSDAEIKADAVTEGDGGEVIVWADGDTRFTGKISATGGTEGGDGGFAEVSGKDFLDFRGMVDLTAPEGIVGTLLLDPADIEINNTGPDNNIDSDPFEPTGGGPSVLTWATLLAALDIADVEVTTVNAVISPGEPGNITITESHGPGAYDTVHALTLSTASAGDIIVNAAVNNAGSGGLILNVGNDLDVNAGLDFDAITVNAGAQTIGLGASAGDVTLDDTELGLITANTLTLNSALTGGGTGIFVDGITAANSDNVGTVELNTTADSDIQFLTGGSVFNALMANAGDQIDVDASVETDTGILSLTGQAGTDSIDIAAGLTAVDTVSLIGDNINLGATVSAAGELVLLRQFTNGVQINLGGPDAPGTLGLTDTELDQITADVIRVGNADTGALSLSTAINPANADELVLGSGTNINDNGNAITVGGLATRGSGPVTLDGAAHDINTFASSTSGAVDLQTLGAVSIGTVGITSGVNLGGNPFTITAGGDVTQANAITNVTDLAVDANAGTNAITLNNASNAITGTVTMTGAATAFRNSVAGGTTLGDISAGSLTVTSDNAITQAGGTTVTATGATAFETLNNDQAITLDNTGNTISGGITLTTAGTDGDVTLRNNGTITFSGLSSVVNGDLTVVQEDTASGQILQNMSGDITVSGITRLTNNNENIGDAEIFSIASIVFGDGAPSSGTSLIDGNLVVGTDGSVSQTDPVLVNGNFTSNASGSTTMDNAGNIFDGTFSASDNSIVLRRVGDVDINAELGGGAVNTTGSLTVIALAEGDEFDSAAPDPGGTAALDLSNTGNSFGGGLVINTGGGADFTTTPAGSAEITQSSDITVGGTATFRSIDDATSQTPFDLVNLANGVNSNTLSGVIQLEGTDVSLANTGTTNLGTSTISNNLTVSSTGPIVDSGVLTVTGTSSFETTMAADTIVLDEDHELTGAVELTTNGGNATLNNNQVTLLGDVALGTGDFDITSADTITQDADTSIQANQLDVETLAGNAELTNAANTINDLDTVSVTGNFRLHESDGFDAIGTIDAGGFVEVGVTGGNVAQTGGSITAGGLLLRQLNAGAATSNFDITQIGNAIGALASDLGDASSTLNLDIRNGTSLDIDALGSVSGVTAGGGDVNIELAAGQSLTSSNGQAITMNGGQLKLRADALGTDSNPIITGGAYTFAANAANGSIFIENSATPGDITVGNIAAPGTATAGVTASAGNTVELVNRGGDFIVNNGITGTGGITLDSSGGITLVANVGSNTTASVDLVHDGVLDSNGGIAQTTAAGTLTLGGDGNIGVSQADPFISSSGNVAFNKTIAGMHFMQNLISSTVSGTVNGDLGYNNAVSAGTSLTLDGITQTGSDATMLLRSSTFIEGSTPFAVVGAGDGTTALALRAGSRVGDTGVPFVTQDIGTVAINAAGGLVNYRNEDTPFTVGSITLDSVTTTGVSAANAVDISSTSSGSPSITLANNVTGSGNVNITVDDSANPGPTLVVNGGVTVQAGAGTGGTVVIGGGVQNNGSVAAGTGTTAFLDGGLEENVIAGGTYASNTTFTADGDIIVTGDVSGISGASFNFISDNDQNNTGGFLLTDSGSITTASSGVGTGNITIEGSSLLTTDGTYLNGAAGLGGGIGNGVVLAQRGTPTVVIDAGGDLTLNSRTGGSTGDSNFRLNENINGNNVFLNNRGILTQDNSVAQRRIRATGSGVQGNITFGSTGQVGAASTAPDKINIESLRVIFNKVDPGGNDLSPVYLTERDSGTTLEGTVFGDLDVNTTTPGSLTQGASTLNVQKEDSEVRLFTSTGSITLNNPGNQVQAFGAVDANSGSFRYDGSINLALNDTIDAAQTVAINLGSSGGQDLTQTSSAAITGQNVEFFFNEALMQSTITASSTVSYNHDGLLQTSGNTSLVTANTIDLQGIGDVGNNLSDGIYSQASNLSFNKNAGNIFVRESSSITVGGTFGQSSPATLNVSTGDNTSTATLNIDNAGINAGTDSNVHLIAGNSTTGFSAINNSNSGIINMSGGDLLLVGRQGVGSLSAPVLTNGSYTLAGTNRGSTGGFFVQSFDGDVTVGSMQAYTPEHAGDPFAGDHDVLGTFDGVRQLATINSGNAKNIRIDNLGGNITVDNIIEVNQNQQNVVLVANDVASGGRIIQGGSGNGVIAMSGGQLILQAEDGIGEIDNALLTSGSFNLGAEIVDADSNATRGFYLTNTTDVFGAGTITIADTQENPSGTSLNLQGVSVNSSSNGDIRIRNTANLGTSNIQVNSQLAPVAGQDILLIADNGAILQGGGAAATLNMNGGNLLLAANQGIGSLASPIRTTGNYDLAVANDDLSATLSGFSNQVASGNINILNTGVGTVTGTGNITVTDVMDLFSAGAGVNTPLGTVSGGRNTADAVDQGAIRIRNDAAGADSGDIIAIDTVVETLGTTGGDAFIEMVAADDLNIGDGQTTLTGTEITTNNGAINLTAANANTGDGIDGILITASDGTATSDTLIQAGGAAGNVNMTATANSGVIDVLGGDADGASVSVNSAELMDVETNALTVLGGNATNGNAFAELVSQGEQNIDVLDDPNNVASGNLLVEGGTNGVAGSGNYALIRGNQTINVANNYDVIGGAGIDAFALTESTATGVDAQNITVGEVMTVRGGTGDGSYALVRTINDGEQDIEVQNTSGNAATDALIISGATGTVTDDNEAGIVSNSTSANGQSITVNQGNLVLAGIDSVSNARTYGTGSVTVGSVIQSAGNQSIDVADGNFDIDGGDVAGSRALVSMSGDDNQQVLVQNGNLTLDGGTVLDTQAIIESASSQSIGTVGTPIDGYLTLAGGSGQTADAFISSVDTQGIFISGNSTLTFAGINNISLGLEGGSDGTDGGDAYIEQTDGGSTQTITTTTGNVVVAGGTGGSDGDAFIRSASNTTPNGQAVTLNNGSLHVLGSTTADGGIANIELTGTGQQSIDIVDGDSDPSTGDAGDLFVTGGADTAEAFVASGGTQDLDADRDMEVQGGTGVDAFAEVTSTGNQDIDVGRELDVLGGSGADGGIAAESTYAAITSGALQDILVGANMEVGGGTGSDAYAEVTSVSRQSVDVTGNLDILGGSGLSNDDSAYAEITSNGVDAGADLAQSILVGGNLTVEADTATAATDAYAEILADNAGAASQFIDVEGFIEVTGGLGTGQYAAITADGVGSGSPSLAQDINAREYMTITGGEGQGASALVSTNDTAGEQQVVVQNLNQLGAAGLTVQGAADSANTGNEAGIVSAATGSDAQVVTVNNGALVVSARDSVSTVSYGLVTEAGTAGAVLQSAG